MQIGSITFELLEFFQEIVQHILQNRNLMNFIFIMSSQ